MEYLRFGVEYISNNLSHCLLYSSKLCTPESSEKQLTCPPIKHSLIDLDSALLVNARTRGFSLNCSAFFFFALLNFLRMLSLLLLSGTKYLISSRSSLHCTPFLCADRVLLSFLSRSVWKPAPCAKLVNSQLADLCRDIVFYCLEIRQRCGDIYAFSNKKNWVQKGKILFNSSPLRKNTVELYGG